MLVVIVRNEDLTYREKGDVHDFCVTHEVDTEGEGRQKSHGQRVGDARDPVAVVAPRVDGELVLGVLEDEDALELLVSVEHAPEPRPVPVRERPATRGGDDARGAARDVEA